MADTKLTALNSFTPVLTDLLYGVDDPGGTPVSGKFTIQVLMDLLEANIVLPNYQLLLAEGPFVDGDKTKLDSLDGVNVKWYGAVGDTVWLAGNLSISSGANVLTVSAGSFTSSDIGKAIAVPGAGASSAALYTTITGVNSTTVITLNDNAGTTLSTVADTVVYGTDDSVAVQNALDAITAGAGGTLYFPSGRYYLGTAITRTLNAGGVIGSSITVKGSARGNTTFAVATGSGNYAFEFLGPSGTFSSHFEFINIALRGAVPGDCHGLKLTGASKALVRSQVRQLDVGIDCEAVLKSVFDGDARDCNVGIYFRESGYFSGVWGASGCNANRIFGSLDANVQYGLVADTFQGIKIGAHFETNGQNNISNGGVSDADRGGIKFINPEGALELRITSEDNGKVSGSDEGKGVVYVVTDADNAGLQWSLNLIACNLKRTAGGPKSVLYVDNHSSAGDGTVNWLGSHLESNGYTPSASNPTFNLTATGQNLNVNLTGGYIEDGATEFALEDDVNYTITGHRYLTPGSVWDNFILPVGGPSNRAVLAASNARVEHTGDTTKTTLATVTVPGGCMGPNGSVEIEHMHSATSSANSKTHTLEFNGASLALMSVSPTTSPVQLAKHFVANRASVSSQVAGPFAVAGGWGAGAAVQLTAINTANDVDLTFTGQLTNSGETIRLERYLVEVIYQR